MHPGTPSRNVARNDQLRRRIAVEAARLMSEHGIRDFHLAKRKAAAHLNVPAEASLPSNSEIEQALREHQRLFHTDQQPQHLRFLREAAQEAMRFFRRFEPRLVGAVLDGTADQHSAICLHLFSDTPEQVVVFLVEHAIDYRELDRRQRLRHDEYAQFPAFLIEHRDARFDLTVLPHDAIRQSPLDRIHERPMRRANLAEVERLLASEENQEPWTPINPDEQR
ncbi:MAG: hypothetical protein ABI304_09500 [Rudaea sp.]